MGLVDEIQRDAINETVSVSTLLRKVKLAAAKLQLPTIENWVDQELNGYKAEVPEYRRLRGIPKAFDQDMGWIPIITRPEDHEIVSRANTGQSVASIEEVLRASSGAKDTLGMPLRHELFLSLNKSFRREFGAMSNFVGRSELAAILDIVRTKVLEWAIELEKSGVKGEGMSFSQEEKKAARNNPSVTIGSIGSFNGFIGDHNTVQNIVGGNLDIQKVKELAHQLRDNLPALVREGADGPRLEAVATAMLEEAENEKPNEGFIKGFIQDARNAISGGAGGLVTAGALALMHILLPGVAG